MGLVLQSSTRGGTAYRRPPFFRTKKLAVIGCTKSHAVAPWHDPSWTIVSHCSARQFCQREPDWYFDLHRPECFRTENKSWNHGYHTWLKTLQTPIFMQKAWPEIPLAVAYPLPRILAEYRAYFTNHAAYMIALAMTEGVTTIGLFGCEYAQDSEYSLQRGSLEYWLGRYDQWGGAVVLPTQKCSLLQYPKGLYGYDSHDEHGKLCGDYVRKPVVTVATKDGIEHRQLSLVDLAHAEGRIPLMPPPPGVSIAWARSGHTVLQ